MSRRTSYSHYMNYYSMTSEAFAIDGRGMALPAWEQELPVRPAVRRPRRRKVVYMRVLSNERFFSMNMVVTLTMIFAGMILLTMSFASIRKYQLDISAMQTELTQRQEEEAVLRAKIAEEYDVTQIEKTAMMRLNMSKPKAYQIVYINAPKTDYVVNYGTTKAEASQPGLLERVMALID